MIFLQRVDVDIASIYVQSTHRPRFVSNATYFIIPFSCLRPRPARGERGGSLHEVKVGRVEVPPDTKGNPAP